MKGGVSTSSTTIVVLQRDTTILRLQTNASQRREEKNEGDSPDAESSTKASPPKVFGKPKNAKERTPNPQI